ncbi:MAG TPA: NeuD/PglB/VioB family sugar acetyltransferase [Mycobacteriales bacterium]|nr:NeuD/PglB/VioB family sugar acetyltransferase [Mycobacteriales bacterium]HVW81496.1 NeuD/PglB/VioB family sugar acetyltransferase [Mycobacteriales bacterium]
MTKPLVVIGAGGFGRETLDVVEAMNSERPSFELVGVLDDAPSETNLARLSFRGVQFLGAIGEWLAQGPREGFSFAVAVGNPSTRRQLVGAFERANCAPATLVHPASTVGAMSELGPGAVVCAGAQISTNVRTGRHVHLNPNATIGHDAALGDFVSVNPAATVSGECVVEEGVLLGAGCVVLQGLTVGRGAVVGAAACVVRSVDPGQVVKGVPAR